MTFGKSMRRSLSRISALSLCVVIIVSGCSGLNLFGRGKKPEPEVAVEAPPSPPTAPTLARRPPPTPQLLDGGVSGRPAGRIVSRRPDLQTPSTAGFGQNRQNELIYSGPNADQIVRIEFADVSIREIARAVLDEVFDTNFLIHPDVSGTASLDLSNGLTKRDLLPTFDIVLRGIGAKLEREGEIFVIRPISSEVTEVAIPLTHARAGQIVQALGPYLTEGSVQAGEDGASVFIAGPEVEVRTLTEVAQFFDSPRFSKVSYGLFPVRNLSADEVAILAEGFLQEIDRSVSVRTLRSIEAILVVANNNETLRAAEGFMRELAVSAEGTSKQIYFHPLLHIAPEEAASTLAQLLGLSGADRAPPQSNSPRELVSPSGELGATSSNPLVDPTEGGLGDSPPPPGGPSPDRSEGTLVVGGATGPRVVADPRRNGLLIEATAREYRRLSNILQRLDQAPAQVLVEATIVEVNLNDTLRFGVQFFFDTPIGQVILSEAVSGDAFAGPGAPSNAAQFPGVLQPILPGFAFANVVGDAQVVIQALDSVTDVRVVSSPRLLILDNESARLQVGDTVPIVTQTASSVVTADATLVNNIEYRDTGVILTVTPEIGAGDELVLEISQEVSSVVPTTTSEIESPTFQEREISSRVRARDNQLIVLAGLIQENTTLTDDGIPLLKEIPVAGRLFSATGTSETRTELLIMLRPRIVRSAADQDRLTAELRQETSVALRSLLDANN